MWMAFDESITGGAGSRRPLTLALEAFEHA
jgi:hypothetical protein